MTLTIGLNGETVARVYINDQGKAMADAPGYWTGMEDDMLDIGLANAIEALWAFSCVYGR